MIKKIAENICIVTAILIVMLGVSSLYAQPVCSVEVTEEQYHITVKSDDTRTPIAISTVDIPERMPIVHDSYYNACIINYDNPQDAKPVQNTLVSIWGYPDNDWGVDTNTSFTGCFSVRLPADSNFTIKAMNPETGKFAKLGGTLVSAGVGQLLNDFNHKVLPFNGDLMNISQVRPEDGIKSHEFGGDEFEFSMTADRSINKHSMVIYVPTIVGQKYVVTLNTDKRIMVYFSDGSRPQGKADILGLNKDVALDFFTATKPETRLYFQAQTDDKTTIKSVTIIKE